MAKRPEHIIPKDTLVGKVWTAIEEYIILLLDGCPDFTGKLEINFKDGIIKDVNETRRTKF